jgi:hypothetical protein
VSTQRALGWVAVVAWSVWACALGGFVSRELSLAPWTPDFGVVLLVALAARLPHGELPWLALAMGCARTAVSIDPPVASLAAVFGAVVLARMTRGVVDIQGAIPRALLAAAGAAASVTWLGVAHQARLARSGVEAIAVEIDWSVLGADAAGSAVSTGLLALLAGGWFAQLPGLPALWRRKTWHVAASSR